MKLIINSFILGVVIGALLCVWSKICEIFGFGQACFALVGTVIPVIVTGGIHVEGFLNTVDSLHCHEKKEKKQDIQKESQVRAFAVIAVICLFMLYGAGLTLIWKKNQLLLLGLSYIMSRILSSMIFVWFPAARTEGSLNIFSSAEHKRTARVVLVTFLALTFITAILIQPIIGSVMALAAMWVWTYFYYMSKKHFNSITEGMAGYFVCLCELSSVLVIGMIGRIM